MNRRGQSMIEYMLVAVALIAVVLALAPRVITAARNVMGQAQAQVAGPSANADTIIPRL